jgi:hypothetical protein
LNGSLSQKQIASNSKNPDAIMINSLQTQQYNYKSELQPVQVSGMELFTTPQTLINPNSDDGRLVPIIDKFRPFMSIESLEISVAPTLGFFSNKTAKLNLVLHDRSRLSEIGELVRPQVYTKTILSISYGWSHPDGVTGTNAYGDLINRMLVKDEKYGIVNASFSFDEVGQVKISLQLSTKGTYELQVLKMSDNQEFLSAEKVVNELVETVSSLREKIGLRRSESLSVEIRPYQFLDAIERGEVINLLSDPEFRKNLDSLNQSLKQIKANPKSDVKSNVDQMTATIDKLFGAKGATNTLKATLDKAVDERMKKLRQIKDDPFLGMSDENLKLKTTKTKNTDSNTNAINEEVVSLGKLMMLFIGEPYQTAGVVNEVQFVFYPFNEYAGLSGGNNIASFPIIFKEFERILKEHTKEKRSNNLTIQEFMLLVQNAFINDPHSFAYGMQSIYRVTPEGKTELIPDVSQTQVTSVMQKIQKNGGTFKMPVVEAYIETLGGRPYGPGEIVAESGKSIMRVHIVDKQASPYAPFVQLLKTQSNLQDMTTDNKPDARLNDLISLAAQTGIEIKNSSGPTSDKGSVVARGDLKATGNFQQVKQFISRVVPTITYGSNFSAISNASLTTQQIPLLSAVQMQNAGKPQQDETNNLGIGGIPMRIIPTQLDLTVLGCPTLQPFQQFFIDFGTGTTADNIYVINSMSHIISPGKFYSSLKMTFADAYGVYESLPAKLNIINNKLKEISKQK